MIVDPSAVLAILCNEPEHDMFSDALADAGVRLMSSVNALEAAVVVSSRKGPYGVREFDLRRRSGRSTSRELLGARLHWLNREPG